MVGIRNGKITNPETNCLQSDKTPLLKSSDVIICLSQRMRETNYYYSQIRPGDWHKPWTEQDIRFAEFLEWLQKQDQIVQDAVTLAVHLTTAYQAKFSPLEHPPVDDEILKQVERVQKRLGVDFLYIC